MSVPPDLTLVNGTLITVDARDSIAEAVAIRGNKIIAVGDTSFIDSLAGPNTRRIDLEGRTVTPGLLDAHAHFSPSQFNRTNILDLSYPRVKSIKDVQEAIAELARKLPSGEWIQGRSWDEANSRSVASSPSRILIKSRQNTRSGSARQQVIMG